MKSRLAMYHIDPSDSTTFVVGKCLIQTHCFLLLVLLTPTGRWDGFALIDSKDVVSVETEHPYLERLRKLLGLWNEAEPVWPGCLPNSILDFFETALCAQRAVSVELCASGDAELEKPPTADTFLMKNNMNYTDQQEIVLRPDSPLRESTTAEGLKKKTAPDCHGSGFLFSVLFDCFPRLLSAFFKMAKCSGS